jgi:hypothetical protein
MQALSGTAVAVVIMEGLIFVVVAAKEVACLLVVKWLRCEKLFSLLSPLPSRHFRDPRNKQHAYSFQLPCCFATLRERNHCS